MVDGTPFSKGCVNIGETQGEASFVTLWIIKLLHLQLRLLKQGE